VHQHRKSRPIACQASALPIIFFYEQPI